MMAAIASRTAPLALDPVERWSAARNFNSFHWGALSQPTVWVPLLVVGALGVAAIVIYRRHRHRGALVVAFGRAAAEANLTPAERTILARLAEAADPRPLTGGYTLSSAFEDGVRRLLAGRATRRLTSPDRRRVQEVIQTLRAKLGFAPAKTTPASGNDLARGDRVTLSHPGATPEVGGTVAAVAGRDVTVRLDEPTTFRTGGAGMLRHVREGMQWEYNVTVIHSEGKTFQARIIGRPRKTNLRRFARVPIRRPVHVARYGFVHEGSEGRVPEFVEGTLHEIAGPGLRLEAEMQADVGERILVVLNLGQEGSLRAVGVVRRRVASKGNGPADFAVELAPVTEEEVARLVKETNAAARRATAGDARTAADAAAR